MHPADRMKVDQMSPPTALTALLPWRAARAIFGLPRPVDNTLRALSRIGFWRSASGLLCVTVVGLAYGEGVSDASVDAGSSDLIVNAILAFIVMILSLAAVYMLTMPRARVTLWPGTLVLFRKVGMVFGTLVLPVVLLNLVIFPNVAIFPLGWVLVLLISGLGAGTAALWVMARRYRGSNARLRVVLQLVGTLLAMLVLLSATGLREGDFVASLIWVLVGLPAFVWSVTFGFLTLYWAARTAGWVGEVHPMLAPICTVLVTVSAVLNKTVYDLLYGLPDRPDEVPFGIVVMLSLGGLAATAALAAAELRHLRALGFGMRTGAVRTV